MSKTPESDRRSFASLAHQAIVGNGECSVKDVAEKLNMKENTLYTKLEGRAKFYIEESRNFLAFVSDPALANYILALSPYFAAERVHLMSTPDKALQRQAGVAVCEAADTLRTVEHAILDGKIDHREKVEIRRQIEDAEQAIASLKSLLNSL